jgi:hypothetical protein
MTISASNVAANFNHVLASQGSNAGGAKSTSNAQTANFDHVLASFTGPTSNSGPKKAGFDHQGRGIDGVNGNSGAPTTQGTVSSSKNGDGTFTKTKEVVNGEKITDKTVTYDNGKTKETEKSVTVNADGSKTVTKTNANGKSSTVDVSKSRDANGNVVITRESTNAKGKTTDSTVSVSKSATGEVDREVSRTNAKGETETLDRVTTKADGVRTVTTTGTGYAGQAIDNESVWTITA